MNVVRGLLLTILLSTFGQVCAADNRQNEMSDEEFEHIVKAIKNEKYVDNLTSNEMQQLFDLLNEKDSEDDIIFGESEKK